jgi:hypothetical protein
MNWFVGSTWPLLILGSSVMADDTPKTVFDFTETDAAREWQTVNDGVMGGVSDGKFKITDKKPLEFYGTLSLENNGGFASVRSKAKKLGLEKGDALVARGPGQRAGILDEPVRPQAAGRLLLSSHDPDQEGRVDGGQAAPGQVRGHVVRAGGQGRWAGRPR